MHLQIVLRQRRIQPRSWSRLVLSSLLTHVYPVEVVLSDEEEVLTFIQNVTIEGEVAGGSFNNLTACIDESVVDNNATETLHSWHAARNFAMRRAVSSECSRIA